MAHKPAAPPDSRENRSGPADSNSLHLLRNPANAEHLLKSIAQANAGEFIEIKLDE